MNDPESPLQVCACSLLYDHELTVEIFTGTHAEDHAHRHLLLQVLQSPHFDMQNLLPEKRNASTVHKWLNWLSSGQFTQLWTEANFAELPLGVEWAAQVKCLSLPSKGPTPEQGWDEKAPLLQAFEKELKLHVAEVL